MTAATHARLCNTAPQAPDSENFVLRSSYFVLKSQLFYVESRFYHDIGWGGGTDGVLAGGEDGVGAAVALYNGQGW